MEDALRIALQERFRELSHALEGSAANVGAEKMRGLSHRGSHLTVTDFPDEARKYCARSTMIFRRYVASWRAMLVRRPTL